MQLPLEFPISTKTPILKAVPLRPTVCSVDRLDNNSEDS